MATGANVQTIDVIRDFRAALIGFTEEAKLALSEAVADVQKTASWIQHDRMGHWRHELRKRHEKVQQCKSELYRAQMQSRDERPSCVLERKALAKAQAAAEEAERKLEGCKRALATLDREGLLFKAALAGFSTSLELDLPNAVAHLDRLMDQLQKYFSLVAPSDDPTRAPSSTALESGSTGGALSGSSPGPGSPDAQADRGAGRGPHAEGETAS